MKSKGMFKFNEPDMARKTEIFEGNKKQKIIYEY